jgi:DNA polymerase III alpha subunit (gram-positive type)
MSADGKLYIFHPGMEPHHLSYMERLKRLSSEEISRLRYLNYDRVYTQFPLNTLDEVLETFKGRCYINVDKFWRHPKEIYDAIRRHDMADQIVVKSAPSEDEVYGALMEFLGDAADGKTLMVAHNARFDMDFLRMTLTRLGVDADIRYADTLKLARQHVPGLFNYKQPTIAEHFGIEIHSAHRAADDARVCGEMLGKIVERILK